MSKLSIITINLNNRAGLEPTIHSVVTQSFRAFELLVIDGGSTDGSVELIRQYENHLAYWVSERDGGIYAAMNKGIRVATGEYCLFLNSGDWLAGPQVLEQVFARQPRADIVAGDIYFYDTSRQAIRWLVPSPDELTARTLLMGTLPHQATLIRRSLFDRIGLYDETLKIASDWLFFLDALLVHGCSYQHHPAPVAYFSMDGISCDPRTESLPRREQLAILRQRYPRFLPDYERLEALEKEQVRWLQSREYSVYRFLDALGLIRLGVWCRRVQHRLQRTLSQA